MKTFLKNNWLSLLLLALTVGATAWAYPQLPEKIPSHFNVNGVADGWSPRDEAAVMLPAIAGAILLLSGLLRFISPRRFSADNSMYGIAGVMLAVTFLMCGVHVAALWAALNAANPASAIGLVISVFCVIMGNYLTKVEPSFFIGIRTPWSLGSRENWNATHRFAGRIFVFGGLAALVLTVFTHQPIWAFSFLIGASLLASAYSLYFFLRYERARPADSV